MATKKGTNKSETLRGTDSNDILLGRGGDDTLIGGAGNDRLIGGDGADELMGGDGNDLLLPGKGGADAIDGGKGIDTVSYANIDMGVYIQINSVGQSTDLAATGDTFFNIERFVGTGQGDNFFLHRAEGYHVFGGGGGDAIRATGGVMRGGDGEDDLYGDTADAWVDTFWLEMNRGADRIGGYTEDQDRIRVSGKEFGIGSMLNSDELFNRSGDSNATGTNAQFIFRMDEDQLFFDPDGTGGEAAILIADFDTTSPIVGLSVEDFQIV